MCCKDWMLHLNETDIGIVNSLSRSISGLGMCGCLLNITVIFRILKQGLCKLHFSKLYFISLATADFAVAAGSVGFTFIFDKVIQVEEDLQSLLWLSEITWVSFTSSLLHVVVITTDRFIATKFPFYHRVNVTRKNVTKVILIMWLISVALIVSTIWQNDIALWCAVVLVPLASLGMIVTYMHIIILAIKRKKALRTASISKPVITSDVLKSINTICLGLSITFTYIFCNLPFSITIMFYLFNGSTPSVLLIVALLTLLTFNTVVDPVVYTLVEIINNKGKKGNLAQKNNVGSNDVTAISINASSAAQGNLNKENLDNTMV